MNPTAAGRPRVMRALAVRRSTIVEAPTWKYIGTSKPERLGALLQPLPFPDLVRRLKKEMIVLCFHREPRTNDPSYTRAVFCGVAGLNLFDWFFNARTGYRGAFFDSPEAGMQANRMLFDELSPSLVNWATTNHTDAEHDWLVESLSQATAKAWLAEEPLGLCAKCAGEWSASYVSELQIQNSRWECASHVHSAWGRQAPKFSKIRFFGGFINAQHQEWVAGHKVQRANQIWEHGWT